MALKPNQVGLALGGTMGFVNLVWVVLVAVGGAQTVVTSLMKMHSVTMTAKVGAFDAAMAIELLVVSVLVGYVIGWVFAHIWNYVVAKW